MSEASKTRSTVAASGLTQPTLMTTIVTSSSTNLQNEVITESQRSTSLAPGRSTIKGYTSSFAVKSTKSDVATVTVSLETTGEHMNCHEMTCNDLK